jgi:hypothetical protein
MNQQISASMNSPRKDYSPEEIKTLISGEYEPGIHKIEFNGSDLSSGVYFYRITAGNFSESKKLQILK